MDITHVEGLRDHVVGLRFTDGVEKTLDLWPYLRGRMFEDIRRRSDGVRRRQGRHEGRHDHLPNGADLAPDMLYEARLSAMEAKAGAS